MRIRNLVPLIFVLIMAGCDGCDEYNPAGPSSTQGSEVGDIKEAAGDLSSPVPQRINGVDLHMTHGWFANIYSSWVYNPTLATVYPVPRLWTPGRPQSPIEIMEQNRQLDKYGVAALVVQFNPNPVLGDFNYWKSVDLGGFQSSKPFFIAYEHINQGIGSPYTPTEGGPKDMNIELNRQAFRNDIDFIFNNVIIPYQSKYVTVDGRAVIYMWSSVQMEGDFGSLLDEVRKKYPVFFIGSGEASGDINKLKILDGIMEYTLGGQSNYLKTVKDYSRLSANLRNTMRQIESETGKRMIFIPTFQAAYDDSKYPGRSTPVMYPRNRQEVEYHAEMIRNGMGSIYDHLGPFVVYSELYEGAAVIESQCLPETVDQPGRFVGCGTTRLQILKEYFGW